jgi:hexokinase
MAPSAISNDLSPISVNAGQHTPSELEYGILQQLESPLQDLPELARSFAAVFHNLASTSAEQFLATPVRALPTGDERGRFLALDLGGTNLRVGVVQLHGSGGGGAKIISQEDWGIPEHLKSGAAEALFVWVAERMRDVVGNYLAAVDAFERENILEEGMELGVTFSFPMEYDLPLFPRENLEHFAYDDFFRQTTHDSAQLMPMGKGFTFTTTNDLSSLI